MQIKDIFIHSAGKSLNSLDNEETKHPYITTSNVYWNSFVLNDLKTMYYKNSEIENAHKKGDLLVLEGGYVVHTII